MTFVRFFATYLLLLQKKLFNFAVDFFYIPEMKKLKMYEADDKIISIINEDYGILPMLSAFGIHMGFGDKTIREVCESQGTETYTFMAVVNYYVNGHIDTNTIDRLSMPTLMHYLKASHSYFIDFELPFVRKELEESLNERDSLAVLILRLYDSYAHSVRSHMQYEEKTLFPFIEKLINGTVGTKALVETFSKHHSHIELKLKELKNIIIKYFPGDGLSNNRLMHTLYDIYNSARWLYQHAEMEENIFIPAIQRLEEKCEQTDVTQKITNMIGRSEQETLSDRERDVVTCVALGMSNKEIADKLNIATNTVITHRRNIAKKLQIHSPAGLTIYAIVNNLVDIGSVNL